MSVIRIFTSVYITVRKLKITPRYRGDTQSPQQFNDIRVSA